MVHLVVTVAKDSFDVAYEKIICIRVDFHVIVSSIKISEINVDIVDYENVLKQA